MPSLRAIAVLLTVLSPLPAGAEAAPTTAPLVQNLRLLARGGDSLHVAWDSRAPMHTLEHRALPDGPWQRSPHIRDRDYNLQFLRPLTRYELRVVPEFPVPSSSIIGTSSGTTSSGTTLSPAVSTSASTVPVGAPPLASAPLLAETTELRPTDFAGFRFSPPTPLDTFTSNTWYPTVEYHDGFLWVLESVGNVLHLSKVDPATRRPHWTREVVPPAHPERSVYQGIMDMTVHEGKLWICWNRQDTGNPAGFDISQSRQMLRSFDFVTAALSDPVTVEPVRPGAGTWEGGITSWRGSLWVLQMDAWMDGGKRRTQIVLRPFRDGRFGEPFRYEECPTPYPYGPSVGVFDDGLVLLFSDLHAYEKDPKREPLLYTLFDGRNFSPARPILAEGRSRYAKGVQLGDRFLLAYKCNLPYSRRTGNRFHDIAVTVLEPRSGDTQTTMVVSDTKYNSSPDLTRVSPDHAFLVFGKWEHVYTDKSDPTANYGTFLTEITRTGNGEGR